MAADVSAAADGGGAERPPSAAHVSTHAHSGRRCRQARQGKVCPPRRLLRESSMPASFELKSSAERKARSGRRRELRRYAIPHGSERRCSAWPDIRDRAREPKTSRRSLRTAAPARRSSCGTGRRAACGCTRSLSHSGAGACRDLGAAVLARHAPRAESARESSLRSWKSIGWARFSLAPRATIRARAARELCSVFSRTTARYRNGWCSERSMVRRVHLERTWEGAEC
jgi:hypothetical protein